MSASVTSSSRRRPLRATRSSSDANRRSPERLEGRSPERLGDRSPERLALRWLALLRFALIQSCEQLLQNHRPLVTCSSIDGSSQPHFGHMDRSPERLALLVLVTRCGGASLSGERALAIRFPISCRNPPT